MKTKIEKYVTHHTKHIPDHLEMIPGIVYVSLEYEGCNFLCPCGCGVDIHLPISDTENLQVSDAPRWGFKELNGLVTFDPSIQMRGGWLSHFFIKEGNVIWGEPY